MAYMEVPRPPSLIDPTAESFAKSKAFHEAADKAHERGDRDQAAELREHAIQWGLEARARYLIGREYAKILSRSGCA